MSRAYARQSRRGREREANTPVSGPRLKPLESSADALPTIRNFVPWRDMEKKLAMRLAARAAAGELTGELPLASPERSSEEASSKGTERSGVRPSFFDHDANDLSYSVYSLADLDARPLKSAPVEIAPPLPEPLSELRAGRWPQQWPPLKTVLGAFAVAVGIFALCTVFAVVVADLTDDLKPSRTPLATHALAIPQSVPVTVAPVAPPPAPVDVAASDITLELDDVAPPRPARVNVPKRLPAKKKGR